MLHHAVFGLHASLLTNLALVFLGINLAGLFRFTPLDYSFSGILLWKQCVAEQTKGT
ncbi:hypothetical protein LZ32DRAFT_610050 [Colletotrichum eremochloae]|nr:hypothetical protein LZ32DRAFT_610050 [Colletotrichum eremochloae]